MRMDLQEPLVKQIESVAEYSLGETVYLLPSGDQGIVFAYIVQKTHIEYLIRTAEQGIMQVEEISLSDTKPINI